MCIIYPLVYKLYYKIINILRDKEKRKEKPDAAILSHILRAAMHDAHRCSGHLYAVLRR